MANRRAIWMAGIDQQRRAWCELRINRAGSGVQDTNSGLDHRNGTWCDDYVCRYLPFARFLGFDVSQLLHDYTGHSSYNKIASNVPAGTPFLGNNHNKANNV